MSLGHQLRASWSFEVARGVRKSRFLIYILALSWIVTAATNSNSVIRSTPQFKQCNELAHKPKFAKFGAD